MKLKIADSHMMVVGCMNNRYIFDRVLNSSAAAPATAALTGAYALAIKTYADNCGPLQLDA